VNTGWTTPVLSLAAAGDEIIAGTGFGLIHRPLAEVLGPGFAGSAPRIVNTSSRGVIAAGGSLVVGFVVTGDAPKRLLVRGVGPGLAAFGVAGAMTDPRLEVFRGGVGSDAPMVAGDNWGDAPNDAGTLAAASASAGAFPLPTGSRDAALVGNFSPGSYTVQLSGAGGAGGVALVEIYEVP
jgi:hypothetical protein